MGKWAQRLAALMSEKGTLPSDCTDKTDKRGLASVLAVTPTGGVPENCVVRPYRLAPTEGDRAHVEPWDDGACARFLARVAVFMRGGFNATDADDLAERLHLRDVEGDNRTSCIECWNFEVVTLQCKSRVLGVHRIGREDLSTLRRCPAFSGKGKTIRARERDSIAQTV